MERELGRGNYSDDEIEQILGIGASETGFVLKGIRETIKESPLLTTGLVLAFGILVGVSLGRASKR